MKGFTTLRNYSLFIIALALCIVLGAAFVFRSQLGSLLDFEKPSGTSTLPGKNSESSPNTASGTSTKPREERTLLPGTLPPYQGKDFKTTTEDPKEMAIFSDDQKKVLRDRFASTVRALEINPDQLDGWINLGELKKVFGDLAGARDAWEYASLIRPKNVISFLNLGELYWRYVPDFPRSESNLRRAIQNDPHVIDSYITLSELYRYSYKEKASMTEAPLFEGLKNNPNDPSLLLYIAGYYRQIGKKDLAITYYEKLLQVQPDNKEAKADLKELQSQ